MKKLNRYSIVTGLAVALFTVSLVGQAWAATTVNLGTAANFAVLAGTAITDTPTSTITGDVGLSPASGSNYAGLTAAEVSGSIYAVDGAGPGGSVNNPALLTTAKNDLTAAYVDAAGRTPTTTFVAGDNQLGGQTLTAGVYAFGHATTANITAASPLKLDAQGDANAVFIFQASSDLITASSSVVQLMNGAQACNVFWQVTSSTTLGTGSTFVGTVMTLTSATLTSAAHVEGRVLARNGAVTLNNNVITRPTCTTSSGGSSSGSGSGSSTPTLPNTGYEPSDKRSAPWAIIALVGVAGVVGVWYIVRKRGA
jgi:hypothetical protein